MILKHQIVWQKKVPIVLFHKFVRMTTDKGRKVYNQYV